MCVYKMAAVSTDEKLREVEKQLEQLDINRKQLEKKKKKLEKELEEERRVEAVNDYFEGKSKLEIVQELCQNLLGDQSDTVTGCLELLKGTYINIFDYVDGNYEKTCDSVQELRKRCRERGFFNREKAKNENLRPLLKKLFF